MNSKEIIKTWQFINDNGLIWYNILCKKYPEYAKEKWIEKYIAAGYAACVSEICLIAQKEIFNLQGYWTKNCKVNGLQRLAKNSIIVLITIKNEIQMPHAYYCRFYHEDKQMFIIDDIANGKSGIPITKANLLSRVKGDPIFISGLFKSSEEKRQIRRCLGDIRIYYS